MHLFNKIQNPKSLLNVADFSSVFLLIFSLCVCWCVEVYSEKYKNAITQYKYISKRRIKKNISLNDK